MSYCPECGEKIADIRKYCPGCGAKLSEEETTQGGSKVMEEETIISKVETISEVEWLKKIYREVRLLTTVVLVILACLLISTLLTLISWLFSN